MRSFSEQIGYPYPRINKYGPGYKILVRICVVTFFLVLQNQMNAQFRSDSSVLDVSKVKFFESINNSISYKVTDKKALPDDSIPYLDFSEKIPGSYEQKIPFELIGKPVYLKFYLYNSSDSNQDLYFFPGPFCDKIELFKASPGNIKYSFAPLKKYSSGITGSGGFGFIRFSPHEKSIFFARLNYVRTTLSRLSPKLIQADFFPYFKTNLLTKKIPANLLNYLTAGILLMMIFYSIAVYLQNYQVEFLFYSVYAFCMGILLFLKSFLSGSFTSFNYFFEGYLDFLIQITGYSFYLLFFRKFLDTRKNHPFLEKVLGISNWVILALTILYAILYFVTDKFSIIDFIENIAKQFLLLVSVIFIIYGLWKKEPLMNYLVAGQCMLTFFSIISFLLIVTPIRISDSPDSIFNDSLFYYQVGLIMELIFFMAGLTYKNKKDLIERVKEQGRLKLENERKEFEKQVAILEAKQQERNRISTDMHDELGSGVTAIRLMSEIVKSKMKEKTLPEIEKISHSANELLNKMNTIIWTMVSSNDTVESLVAYIRAFGVEFFESTPIDCHFSVPATIPSKDLSGEKRRNLFLCVKEALNNVLKHSHASHVIINIRVDEKLTIEISDDGVGINMDKLRKFGNGLQNMKKRMESIEGDFSVENRQGTTTILGLAL
jgi:signal transduction histidine kinase